METVVKKVDGFRFMPPALGAWICRDIPDKPFDGEIPWTPLERPIEKTTFALMTSAGINMKKHPPFNTDRERMEPLWGDPSYREIDQNISGEDYSVNHLHINTDYIYQDINVILPLNRFQEFKKEGKIGSLAPTAYSFYGFQIDTSALMDETMPIVADKMKKEGVHAVLLTPA